MGQLFPDLLLCKSCSLDGFMPLIMISYFSNVSHSTSHTLSIVVGSLQWFIIHLDNSGRSHKVTLELEFNWKFPSEPSQISGDHTQDWLDITSQHIVNLTPSWARPDKSAGGGPPPASLCWSPQPGKTLETKKSEVKFYNILLFLFHRA
mgnify:FL=1